MAVRSLPSTVSANTTLQCLGRSVRAASGCAQRERLEWSVSLCLATGAVPCTRLLFSQRSDDPCHSAGGPPAMNTLHIRVSVTAKSKDAQLFAQHNG